MTNVNYQQSMSPPLADNKYILHWLDCYHLHIAQRNLLLADNIKCYLVDCHSAVSYTHLTLPTNREV